MDMASGTYLKWLAPEVKAGRIKEKEIDDAVRPILEAKIRMGLFEHPYADLSKCRANSELARIAPSRAPRCPALDGAPAQRRRYPPAR